MDKKTYEILVARMRKLEQLYDELDEIVLTIKSMVEQPKKSEKKETVWQKLRRFFIDQRGN